MGTHPIFESDFDCLTDDQSVHNDYRRKERSTNGSEARRV